MNAVVCVPPFNVKHCLAFWRTYIFSVVAVSYPARQVCQATSENGEEFRGAVLSQLSVFSFCVC